MLLSPHERVRVLGHDGARVDQKELEVGLLERPEALDQRGAVLDLVNQLGANLRGRGGQAGRAAHSPRPPTCDEKKMCAEPYSGLSSIGKSLMMRSTLRLVGYRQKG